MTKKRRHVNDKAVHEYWLNEVAVNSAKWSPILGDTVIENIQEGDCCYACGRDTELDNCHIVPFALGGTEEHSNIFLMCKSCHKLNPDTIYPEIFFRWVKSVGHWIDQEYKEMYKALSVHVPEAGTEDRSHYESGLISVHEGGDMMKLLTETVQGATASAGKFTIATRVGLYVRCLTEHGKAIS